jgi:hypothetical protein
MAIRLTLECNSYLELLLLSKFKFDVYHLHLCRVAFIYAGLLTEVWINFNTALAYKSMQLVRNRKAAGAASVPPIGDQVCANTLWPTPLRHPHALMHVCLFYYKRSAFNLSYDRSYVIQHICLVIVAVTVDISPISSDDHRALSFILLDNGRS